ncbi:hypothetical protein GCM10020358_72710 [Amorphoplanes nipponensis]|uniref:Uncharacterized protein n=1 Tax=Actinoplanes nipponensis TaxID=135950 RepID=A0A919JMV4_9ACTN|nr:hypothetical protein [Actinoplanes nipponensis]GIE49689.1 hypothetical protein Ani05nite_32230 [Actinoplanes nipponensis]
MRLSIAAPVAAAVLLSVLPAAPALAEADTAAPEVHSITFAESSVTVSGLETHFVEVRVRLTDETGVQQQDYVPSDQAAGPSVEVDGGLNRYVVLRRVEGTDQDGIWAGSMPVTSAWSGTIEPVGINAIDKTFRNTLDLDPRTVVDTPSLQVQSSHRPMIEMTFAPEPADRTKPVTQRIRAWDNTTGDPWPSLPLQVGSDNSCVEDAGTLSARTGADGIYQRTLNANEAQWLQCAWVTGTARPGVPWPPTMLAVDSAHVRYSRYAVSATPAATSVPAGTNVNVDGNVTPLAVGKTVRLQRLYPDNIWRQVSTGQVRASGRYTVVATPGGQATYSYRVYAPGDAAAVGGTSKVFTIRGT